MAGDWIKMRSNLDTDWRVLSIAQQLSIPELHVVGCLWKLWVWADQHTLDGNALRVTAVTLDRFACVTGFAAALRNVGWLEGHDNALCFPRFAEHNGQTAKTRCETNKRVAKHRNAKTVTDVTQKPLPEKRREEKRREENKEREPPSPVNNSNACFLTPPSAEFERFWEAYPKKIKRREACEQWEAAIAVVQSQNGMTRVVAVDWIIGKARELSVSTLAQNEPQFLPGAAAFLKDERFFDDVNEWNARNSKPEIDLFGSLRRFNERHKHES